MAGTNHTDRILCTVNDWKTGVHEAWEVAAHEEAIRFRTAHGRTWTFQERAGFIDRYLGSHSWVERNKPVRCSVCSDMIAEAVLSGKDPWEMEQSIKTLLREAGARFHPGIKRISEKRTQRYAPPPDRQFSR